MKILNLSERMVFLVIAIKNKSQYFHWSGIDRTMHSLIKRGLVEEFDPSRRLTDEGELVSVLLEKGIR